MEIHQKEFNQMEIDYSPSCWSNRFEDHEKVIQNHVETCQKLSEESVCSISNRLNIAYGTQNKQKLDIFGEAEAKSGAPIFAYVHGGYWQDMSRGLSRFPVKPFVNHGYIVIIIGYEQCPDVDLGQVIEDVSNALKFVFEYAASRLSRVVKLCGHSAGAHLILKAFQSEWFSQSKTVVKLLKSIFLVSGIYDLEPLVSTSINSALNLTRTDAIHYSATNQQIHQIFSNMINSTINIVYGEFDPPEFKTQSSLMHKELISCNVKISEIKDIDHFAIVEGLAEEDYQLTIDIISQVK